MASAHGGLTQQWNVQFEFATWKVRVHDCLPSQAIRMFTVILWVLVKAELSQQCKLVNINHTGNGLGWRLEDNGGKI